MAESQIGHTESTAVIGSQPPGPTLLPGPVAQAVSLATRSTSFAIRLGSLFSSYGLDAARFTTLSSLQLARGVVEIALSRAAKDTLAHSNSDLAAADAETILERSLESLHYAVTQVVFWTSASFRLTGTTLTAASEVSQLVLSSLDQILGSTDSSRAVASIVTLIRREFNNPATGARGEKVGVLDLVLALSALAYLQRACRACPAEEKRRQSFEETIWDVVVLNDGQRIDVEDDKAAAAQNSSGAVARGYDNDETVLARLKAQILKSLPPGTSVSISNAVSSTQTITVDVQGSRLPSLPTPPGAEIIETQRPASVASSSRSRSSIGQEGDSSYRVVYRIERDRLQSTSMRREDDKSGPIVVELSDSEPLPSPQAERTLQVDTSAAFSPASSASPSPVESPSDSDFATDVPVSPLASPVVMSPEIPETRKTLDARRLSESKQNSPAETTANQKRTRTPLAEPNTRENFGRAPPRLDAMKRSTLRKKSETGVTSKSAEKKSGLKQVFKGKGQSISSIWNKEPPSADTSRPSKHRPQWKSPGSGSAPDPQGAKPKPSAARGSDVQIRGGLAARRPLQAPELEPLNNRASYVAIHEHRRDSIVSQADTYSKRSSGELRPASPSLIRTDYSSQESTSRPRSGVYSVGPPSPPKNQHLSTSHAPSLYSLATNDSQSSLVLSSYYQKSSYNGCDALSTLRREGFVDGAFPAGHLLPNIARYMRFSSACYGSHFLKVMGISTTLPSLGVWDGTHHDIRHFAHHTESEAGSILLASFVDPQGGSDGSGATGTGLPLVHYISLDHAAKAVVLACRGTLGFEDVMADIACEYDDLTWRGRKYRVHKGMHASARRILYGDDGRVLVTIKEALREFPDYGLVLCGHSLGAGVTSLLGVMLAQPNPDGPGFVISVEPHAKLVARSKPQHEGIGDLRLPSGRRIHVYAYAPPGVMSPALRKITRGLITSVVHGNDLVPHLSLGLLHDFQALALAFKNDENKTKAEIRQRIWHIFQSNMTDSWRSATPRAPAEADEQWILPALNALRDTMKGADKLIPPGEVFVIESQRVLRRDAFVLLDDGPIGRPAQRVVLKYIRDVEARFNEVRFGASMLMDHSPANYEDALNMLRLGVVD
ncbi:hypothetical protein HIM_06338 [Hirsutella minnesotensis 3608]|uniref:sn-1-specific diacylglycerol lipase n=1 Tax=Hirsutella minnesotensis 3608 TaxID=1043627 RepID=A0A0F7ZZJ5_9HYPO|nr:hypothetical protein HIM_06338 [Hirsutella minnesotensis 3608]